MKYKLYDHYTSDEFYVTIMEINNDTLKLKMWCEGTGDVYDTFTTEKELTNMIERFNMKPTNEGKWVQCSEVRYQTGDGEYETKRFEAYENAEDLVVKLINSKDCTLLEYIADTEYTIEDIQDAELITDLDDFLR